MSFWRHFKDGGTESIYLVRTKQYHYWYFYIKLTISNILKFLEKKKKDKIKIDYRTIGTASGYGYDRQSASFDHLMRKHGFNIENVDGVGSCAVERWLTETFANTKVIKVLY